MFGINKLKSEVEVLRTKVKRLETYMQLNCKHPTVDTDFFCDICGIYVGSHAFHNKNIKKVKK